MKTILVPTDGSYVAIRALEVAIDLARANHATLKLLHVLMRDKEPAQLLRRPELLGVGPDIVKKLKAMDFKLGAQRLTENTTDEPHKEDNPVTEQMLRQIGNHILERAEARVVERGIVAEALDLADGQAVSIILATAETVKADAIVMGTRGLRLTETNFFGSVFQEVCRAASITCVAVH